MGRLFRSLLRLTERCENRFRLREGASAVTLETQLEGRGSVGVFACRRRFRCAVFGCVGETCELSEMSGRHRVVRRMKERLLHCALGVFDGAPAMPHKAVADPGLRPAWREPHGLGKGALGLGDFVARKQSAAVRIMCLRKSRRAVTGFACGPQCLSWLVQIKMRKRRVQERIWIVRRQRRIRQF